MRKIFVTVCAVLITAIYSASGQESNKELGLGSITTNTIKAQLGFLASDWTEGRMAGEKGEAISADYIASILQLSGVLPGGDMPSGGGQRSYFQNFSLNKTIPGDEQVMKIKWNEGLATRISTLTYNIDFTLRNYNQTIETEAPIVFAGYCFKNDKIGYNDFKSVDVKGKFVLKIPGIPQAFSQKVTSAEITDYYNNLEAELRKMGAIGLIDINNSLPALGRVQQGNSSSASPSENTPRPGYPSGSYSIASNRISDNFIRITINEKTTNELLSGSGINLEEYIKKINAGEQVTIEPKKLIYVSSVVKNIKIPVKNVIGIIPGNNPDKVIVIGAHYDHMGMGNGYIWNGADDNGSGTVGAMTIARAIMATGKKPEKTIIIALWTAEEEGLLGSKYWIQNPTCPIKNVVLNVNFDMISRYISDSEPKKVTLTYTDTYSLFKDITAANVKKYNIDLLVDYQPSPDPPGGTDHRSFVAAGIPIIRFKPGHREMYHTPGDELKTINWDIMEKIIKVSFLDIWDLSEKSW